MREFHVRTGSRSELTAVTAKVQEAVASSRVSEGICIIFVPHTTAGLVVNEGADPAVCHDALNTLEQLVPWMADYRHNEGNSAAHVKSLVCGISVSLPVSRGKVVLGTWQEIYLAEFDGPRLRRVIVQVLGR